MDRLLMALLGLSVLVDLVLGVWAGFFWESYVRQWLPYIRDAGLAAPVPAPPGSRDAAGEVRLLGHVLGLCLLCFAAVQALALDWIRRRREGGHALTLLFALWLIASSTVVFLIFRHPAFLWIDGARGVLLAVVTVWALRAPQTLRELRLPPRPAAGRDRSAGRGRAETKRDPGRPGRGGRKRPGTSGSTRSNAAAGRQRGERSGARDAQGRSAADPDDGRKEKRGGGDLTVVVRGRGKPAGGGPDEPVSAVEALDRLSRLDPDHRPSRRRRGRSRRAPGDRPGGDA